MEIFTQSTKCISFNQLITKEFTGPKHFVITRVLCSNNNNNNNNYYYTNYSCADNMILWRHYILVAG